MGTSEMSLGKRLGQRHVCVCLCMCVVCDVCVSVCEFIRVQRVCVCMVYILVYAYVRYTQKHRTESIVILAPPALFL